MKQLNEYLINKKTKEVDPAITEMTPNEFAIYCKDLGLFVEGDFKEGYIYLRYYEYNQYPRLLIWGDDKYQAFVLSNSEDGGYTSSKTDFYIETGKKISEPIPKRYLDAILCKHQKEGESYNEEGIWCRHNAQILKEILFEFR